MHRRNLLTLKWSKSMESNHDIVNKAENKTDELKTKTEKFITEKFKNLLEKNRLKSRKRSEFLMITAETNLLKKNKTQLKNEINLEFKPQKPVKNKSKLNLRALPLILNASENSNKRTTIPFIEKNKSKQTFSNPSNLYRLNSNLTDQIKDSIAEIETEINQQEYGRISHGSSFKNIEKNTKRVPLGGTSQNKSKVKILWQKVQKCLPFAKKENKKETTEIRGRKMRGNAIETLNCLKESQLKKKSEHLCLKSNLTNFNDFNGELPLKEELKVLKCQNSVVINKISQSIIKENEPVVELSKVQNKIRSKVRFNFKSKISRVSTFEVDPNFVNSYFGINKLAKKETVTSEKELMNYSVGIMKGDQWSMDLLSESRKFGKKEEGCFDMEVFEDRKSIWMNLVDELLAGNLGNSKIWYYRIFMIGTSRKKGVKEEDQQNDFRKRVKKDLEADIRFDFAFRSANIKEFMFFAS